MSLLLLLSFAIGCGGKGSWDRGAQPAYSVHGHVHGGQQPVTHSRIQLYAVGTAGVASAAEPLVSVPVYTDSNGDFSLTGLYTCPTADSPIFITSTGGNSGFGASAGNNAGIALMASLGPCGAITDSTFVTINEVTTVGSIWPVAAYMASATQLGSNPGDSVFGAALASINEFVNTAQGTSPGSPAPTSYFADAIKLYSLADVIAACINSPGGNAGDGTPCGTLFQSTDYGGPAPTDTIAAALSIAQHPQSQVDAIFRLIPPSSPFEPSLSSTPSDWTLNLIQMPAAPVISPGSGTYYSAQSVTIADTASNAAIHYTVDGSAPTVSSPLYSAPITVSSNETVLAAAFLGSFVSVPAQATYRFSRPQLAFTTLPTAGSVGNTLSPAPVVSLVDSMGNVTAGSSCLVDLGLAGSPSSGTLAGNTAVPTANGSATFSGLSFTAPGIYGLTATCPGIGTVTSANISVTAPSIGFTLAQNQIGTYATQTGTVTLGVAPSTTLTVSLTSSNPSSITVSPNTLTFVAGQTFASFSYIGVAPGSSMLSATAPSLGTATVSVTDVIPTITSAFFGMTTKSFATVSPSISFGITRSWDGAGLDWSSLNPSRGVYNFAALDTFITRNQARSVGMIYTFGRTPQWASSQPSVSTPYGPGQCAPPANMTDWDNFVTAVVTHAAGKIKYWELWNEADNPQMWCADQATSANVLVSMARDAYNIIKSIDPNATVLSPSMTGSLGPTWFNWYLYEGGGHYMDVFAFHGYWDQNAEDVLPVIANYRSVLAQWQMLTTPVWDTEASWASWNDDGSESALPTAVQVDFIPKSYLLQLSQGVQRFAWYAWDGGPVWGGMWSSATGASPAATAYSQTYRWLVGATLTAPCSEDSHAVWTCSLTRPGGWKGLVVWISNASYPVTLSAGYTGYVDLSGATHSIAGNSVTATDAPILVETGTIPN